MRRFGEDQTLWFVCAAIFGALAVLEFTNEKWVLGGLAAVATVFFVIAALQERRKKATR